MNNTRPSVHQGSVQSSRKVPAWWLVFVTELNHLWLGGKAPLLMLIFCCLQGAFTYTMLADPADPTPPKEMVYFALENAVAVGLFIGVIIGADSISGERERLTLEALLLAPASRRQIVVGKFLAGISPWPAAFILTVPFLVLLSQGDEMLGPALVLGAAMGTLLVPAFTAMAMLVSSWSSSNKTSLFVSLVLYLMFLIPTQLPGGAQTGMMGKLFKRLNPIESNGHFLEKILVNNRTLAEYWPWITSPVLFTALVYVLLFRYAGPALQLEGGGAGKFWSNWSRRVGVQSSRG